MDRFLPAIIATLAGLVPKLQILTAAQILDHRRPLVPFGHTEGYKKAEREVDDRQGSLGRSRAGRGRP